MLYVGNMFIYLGQWAWHRIFPLPVCIYTSSGLVVVNNNNNRLCIMFKIIALFIITLLPLWYVRVDILLTCWKHLYDRIISLRGEVSVHITSLTPSLFIEVPVPSLESDRSCICVLGVLILIFYLALFRQCGIFVLFFNLIQLLKYYISNVCTAYSPFCICITRLRKSDNILFIYLFLVIHFKWKFVSCNFFPQSIIKFRFKPYVL